MKVTNTRLRNSRIRTSSGFTLIELLVVVVIIGIIASISSANIGVARERAKNSSLISNMHTNQVVAQAYASDNSGLFPPDPTAMRPYYRGGGNSVGAAPGIRPMNPYSAVDDEPLFSETIANDVAILAVRAAPPGASPGTIGQTGYSQCNTGTSYSITGCDGQGKRVAGPNNSTLVLSNL